MRWCITLTPRKTLPLGSLTKYFPRFILIEFNFSISCPRFKISQQVQNYFLAYFSSLFLRFRWYRPWYFSLKRVNSGTLPIGFNDYILMAGHWYAAIVISSFRAAPGPPPPIPSTRTHRVWPVPWQRLDKIFPATKIHMCLKVGGKAPGRKFVRENSQHLDCAP
jgi:hypothetical protein